MENASKALIIAGAVLISILLIAVGVMIFNQATGVFDETGAQMDEQTVRMFNQKFEGYDGQQRGSSVKSLISTVITNNDMDQNARTVSVNGKTTSTDLSAERSGIVNGSTYKVEILYTGKLVSGITVTKI